MRTKTFLSVVIGLLFAITFAQAQAQMEETWQDALCEDTQGSGGEGTWLKATYPFGYMNNESDENKGFYIDWKRKRRKNIIS